MLYMIFSQYGKVVDVIAKKGVKLRGQAWVVFQDKSAATNALRGKQGFNFYEKPLKLQYAKNKSDAVAKADGTFDVRLKRKRDEEAAERNAASSGSVPGNANKVAKIVSNTTPNRILFAQELPVNFDEVVLSSLFQQCQGFVEIRMVPGNKKIAFIEFQDEVQATLSLKQLQGFQLSETDTLQLTYGNL
eukprot:CAMPEP_0119034056 /NCGR_PEP_ID=MMETSP1177-20130426/1110_1 /TAXON_ID=2985 /ORGANISM="Ochromonas sp, Strain CCMP1899" /LENGTH=188 /DNA_ID=CAMNT_0006991259 /DNA_START=162 /DNA_END=728 /DNA_ORIENTATION=+